MLDLGLEGGETEAEKAGRALLAEGTAFANKGSGRKACAGSGCDGTAPGEVPHSGSPGRVWSLASPVFWKALRLRCGGTGGRKQREEGEEWRGWLFGPGLHKGTGSRPAAMPETVARGRCVSATEPRRPLLLSGGAWAQLSVWIESVNVPTPVWPLHVHVRTCAPCCVHMCIWAARTYTGVKADSWGFDCAGVSVGDVQEAHVGENSPPISHYSNHTVIPVEAIYLRAFAHAVHSACMPFHQTSS